MIAVSVFALILGYAVAVISMTAINFDRDAEPAASDDLGE